MFHMLTCLNLKSGVAIDEFRESVAQFATSLPRAAAFAMQDLGLAEATGPIGRRQRHPIMDTTTKETTNTFL